MTADIDLARLSLQRASRTDKGVSAAFYTMTAMLPETVQCQEIKESLAKQLPEDMRVFHVQ